MASTTSVDMTEVCRCCLQKENDLICIFKGVPDTSTLSFAVLVKNCVGLEITVGDGLPDQICSGCSEEASRFFNFKKMCLSSDQLLRPIALTELEPLKEVACQTDEYCKINEDGIFSNNAPEVPASISSGARRARSEKDNEVMREAQNKKDPTSNKGVSWSNSEERKSSTKEKCRALEDSEKSTPNNENVAKGNNVKERVEKVGIESKEVPGKLGCAKVEKSVYDESELNPSGTSNVRLAVSISGSSTKLSSPCLEDTTEKGISDIEKNILTNDSGNSTLNITNKYADSFSPRAEVQESVMEEDIAINTPDLPLSEESIFSVLDIAKEKDTDVIEVNELGEVVEKLSSCNSPVSEGDFSDWLEGNEAKERGVSGDNDTSNEIMQLSNSVLRENEESDEGCSSPDDIIVLGVKIADKEVSRGKQMVDETENISMRVENTKRDDDHSDDNHSDDDDVVMLEELRPDEKKSNLQPLENKVVENSRGQDCESEVGSCNEAKPTPSMEGKLTVKSIEALTIGNISKETTTPMVGDLKSTEDPTALKELTSTPKETESSVNCKEDLTLCNLLKESAIKEIGVNAGGISSGEQSSQMNNKTLGQIITLSLDKSSVKVFKIDKSNEDSADPECNSHQGVECANSLTDPSDITRKRSRTSEDKTDEVEVVHGSSGDDPSAKKPRTTDSSSVSEKEESTKEIHESHVEDVSSQSVEGYDKELVGTKPEVTGDADGVTEMESGDESTNIKDSEEGGLRFEEDDIQQLKNLSDDGLFEDDDSVSNSSGSEYIPADSPTRSDDSLRVKRTVPKSKNHVKSVNKQISKLREQGFNIRECSVVLSDIAHPSSTTVTTPSGASSQLSITSQKSSSESDLKKETEETSPHTSMCTAWIKVEPESTLEEMEEEALEEGTAEEENAAEDIGGPKIEHDGSWSVIANDMDATQSQGISAETQKTLAKFVSGRKRFLCPFCAKAFRTKNQMMLHRSQHTGDLPFPCEVCGKRFALRCRLVRHMSVHDASINCEFCGMDFKTHFLLGKHIKAKHTIPSYSYDHAHPHAQALANKSVQRFPCRLCPKVFSTINGLRVHKRVHFNSHISTFKVSSSLSENRIPSEGNTNAASENSCKICGMDFPNPLYLKSHMVCHTIIRPNSGKVNSIENSKSSETAEESQRTGGGGVDKIREENINVMEPTVLIHESPSNYGESSYQHQNQPYTALRQFICSVCSQIFQSRNKLMRHQSLTHHSLKSLKCDICPAVFSNADQLHSHKLSHQPSYTSPVDAPKKEHKCTVCGKEYPKRSRLIQHMAIHSVIEGPVSCEVCRKYFANLELLNIHKKTHENGQGMPGTLELTCSVCHRVFGKRSRLKRHMLLHESQSFPCAKCHKTFISQELLTEHQVSHAVAPAEVEEQGVACTACGRTFANKGRLKQHVVVHTRSGFVSCKTCFKVFANNQVLEMHAQICAHTDESSTSSQSTASIKSASIPHPSSFISCSSCGKAFPSKELLTEHEKTCVGLTVVKKLDGTWKVLDNEDRTRVGVKQNQNAKNDPGTEPKFYACKVCGKRFNNYHGLNSHMRFHQETVGIYKCELCNKKFSSRNKLSQHMSSHTAVYRCGICSQAFGMVDELKKHVGQCMAAQSGITPNYFFCNGCSEVFNLLEELAEHVKSHADEFPHVCTDCYKVFAHSTQLNRHMSSHAKEETNKHACQICQKTFSHNGALEKHMVVHTGEKRFQCSYCFQRFSQKSSLNRHQLTQHETKSGVLREPSSC